MRLDFNLRARYMRMQSRDSRPWPNLSACGMYFEGYYEHTPMTVPWRRARARPIIPTSQFRLRPISPAKFGSNNSQRARAQIYLISRRKDHACRRTRVRGDATNVRCRNRSVNARLLRGTFTRSMRRKEARAAEKENG